MDRMTPGRNALTSAFPDSKRAFSIMAIPCADATFETLAFRVDLSNLASKEIFKASAKTSDLIDSHSKDHELTELEDLSDILEETKLT